MIGNINLIIVRRISNSNINQNKDKFFRNSYPINWKKTIPKFHTILDFHEIKSPSKNWYYFIVHSTSRQSTTVLKAQSSNINKLYVETATLPISETHLERYEIPSNLQQPLTLTYITPYYRIHIAERNAANTISHRSLRAINSHLTHNECPRHILQWDVWIYASINTHFRRSINYLRALSPDSGSPKVFASPSLREFSAIFPSVYIIRTKKKVWNVA